jgi:NADH:ubiquinone oxidoreductase subunit F (NADH-binding)
MQKSMNDLSSIIRSQIELYEQQMSNAMAEGNEVDMRRINDDFEKEVGKNVCAFAEMAGEPLRSMLVSLFDDCQG